MADQPPATDRRSFLSKAASVAIGGLVAVVAPLAALFPILDPLRRGSDRRRMVRVAALAAIPESGEPRKVAVLDTLVDAWNRTDNVPVGSVYVQRTGEETVRVLHSVCPHLGCSVGYSAESHGFYCPCHKSRFAIDGTIADPKSPSPRAMDELEAEVRNGEVWVRFQNFRKGSPEKIPV